jgi:hypothetical protein
MTSAPIRDPLADHFITPQNAAFLFIDYQPTQLATIRSMDPALLLQERRLDGQDHGLSDRRDRPQRPPAEGVTA